MENKMKKILFLLVIIGVLLFSFNCKESTPDAEKDQQDKTKDLLKEANAQLGLPAIKNFQEKKLAKMIFELRDQEDLICYAYLVNKMTGRLVFLGKCVGFGLPYSVQYTNPEQQIDDPNGNYEAGSNVLPQADPNGLYMPEGLSATWLMMIDSRGEARPVYVEPEIVVSPFPLH
jgi:hypothetical protein